MSDSRLVKTALALMSAIVLVGAAPNRGERLDFFDNDQVSFDEPKDSTGPASRSNPAAAPASPPASAALPPPPPPGAAATSASSDTQEVEAYQARTTEVRAPSVSRVGPTPRHTPGPPGASPVQRGVSVAPRPNEVKALSSSEVEVVSIRPLTQLERETMAKSLRCQDPLAADLKLSPRVRGVIAGMLSLPPDKFPQRLWWTFSPTGECFDRVPGMSMRDIDQINDAVRRAWAKGRE